MNQCEPPLRLGPTFLFEDPVSAAVVQSIHKLGPCYFGSFQAPVLSQNVSSSPDLVTSSSCPSFLPSHRLPHLFLLLPSTCLPSPSSPTSPSSLLFSSSFLPSLTSTLYPSLPPFVPSLPSLPPPLPPSLPPSFASFFFLLSCHPHHLGCSIHTVHTSSTDRCTVFKTYM